MNDTVTQHRPRAGIGSATRRTEDAALLKGEGRYTADFAPANVAHALVLRSPYARARFTLDASAARALPGVLAVLTAADVAGLGGLPSLFNLPDKSIRPPLYPILVTDEVRHVGDAMAFVVAESVEVARDALEAIAIDWDEQPPVIGIAAALESRETVWPSHAGNIVFDTAIGDDAATRAAFARAAHVAELRLVNQRVVTNYLEPRAVVADYDAASGRWTLILGSQGAHRQRDLIAKFVLKVPPERLHVMTPDVGGGFGTKLFPYREYALAAVAAERLGRPVKWVADRADHFLGDAQGRDNHITLRMAMDEDGRFLAMTADLVADMGAYLSLLGPFIPYGGAQMLPGVYDIPAAHIRIRGVFTNTVPVDAYRGAGRPEAAYAIERLVDAAARTIGLEPDEIRRRNFIRPDAMPYRTATGKVYDSGEFAAHLTRAQTMIDWAGFESRAEAARARGLMRGIGLACYVEVCGGMGPQAATVALGDDGRVTVLIGTQSTGQGHRTAYQQLVAEQFGVDLADIDVVQGDTDRIASGVGTGGSSSIPVGGVAVARATTTLGDKLKRIAAERLEVGIGDLEIAQGSVRVIGTDRAMTFADVARAAPDPAERAAEERFAPEVGTFPNGTHIAEVEIDPETGATRIVGYVIVDDFGVTLNPLLLLGQIHGGAVQGIGQALCENTVYDAETGQLVTGSLMDYALPRAADMPTFAFETHNVPCKTNPLGVKGAGEAGTIGAAPAVMNAVGDALWRAHHIAHIDMPATPFAIWSAIRDHQRRHRF